ncbi:MAG: FxsA family protein [Mycobacterium sp.]|uniref:FxsA family protein n=1 Tax=Mycobacterium sp. TaxID=1785 RepID=UPI001EBC4E9C|nr:FxsA family protein [Mycobacterium sp.]MBW0018519.1 FxsA family protein [Mycobacterium sp.]
MVARWFLIYAVVELAVFAALAATIGFGWTLFVLVATFALGIGVWAPLAGWQLRTHLVQLRSGLLDPGRALGDSALVTLASGLVLVPGLVTTVLGLLLLLPPVRAAARPALTAVAMRRLGGSIPLITDVRAPGDGRNYIDGEVLDVWDVDEVEPPALPDYPNGGRSRSRPASSSGWA